MVNARTWNSKLQKVSTNHDDCAQSNTGTQTMSAPDNIDFPKRSLQHSGFREVLTSPKLATHISAIVIDEAHCISQWGDKFHEEYSRLGTLQAFVPSQVPVLVASATMPPHILKQVCTTMHIDIKTSYYLNLGVDWPNITWEVRHMRAGKSNFESLQLVLPKKFGGEVNENNFKQTMVFGDNINVLMSACWWTWDNILPDLHGKVAVFHSWCSPWAKDVVLEWYAMGKITVLFMTEAVGMVSVPVHKSGCVSLMSELGMWFATYWAGGTVPGTCFIVNLDAASGASRSFTYIAGLWGFACPANSLPVKGKKRSCECWWSAQLCEEYRGKSLYLVGS